MFGNPEWAKSHWLMVAVGSRVTCDPAPLDTDEDWLILCPDPDASKDHLVNNSGFVIEGNPQFYTGNDNGQFQSYRLGDINAIVTPSDEFYELFLTATELAKRFNLLEKDDRIALFQAVLYGVQVHNSNRPS